ncbi:MAG: hypothetical protein Q9221_002594 [Calogaya cf. arnoldii]
MRLVLNAEEYYVKLLIVFRIWIPRKAWQQPNGMRTDGVNHHHCFARHPHLAPPSIPCSEGVVDVIDPSLETIIALLSLAGGRKLKLYLKLGLTDFHTIPGLVGPDVFGSGKTEGGSTSCEGRGPEAWLSMDLPNLIEKWRAEYTSDDRLRSVDILWTTATDKQWLRFSRKNIKGLGWQIFEETEDKLFEPIELLSEALTTFRTVYLSLRREKLMTKTPEADLPFPLDPSLSPSSPEAGGTPDSRTEEKLVAYCLRWNLGVQNSFSPCASSKQNSQQAGL